uniref:potassium channel subfamily K member 16-like isoform X1 n=1 Tax=Styela clava TaxID=7725 RepID=UPI00193A6730|nr:potassium channel subfamily K member 16-like isoform X1 [Styela clava]
MKGKILFVLVVCYFIYLVIGGAIFMAIEGPYNKKLCLEANESVILLINNINNDSANASMDDLRNLTTLISESASYGFEFNFTSLTSTCTDNWSFEGSVFFAGTVVTTIGYGNMSPKSPLGRAICIIYALIGIPLFALMFGGLGEKIANLVLKLEERINGKASRTWVRKLVLILIVTLSFVVFCLLIPSAIFQAVEVNWNYGDSFYYSFITISTIGFGDFVAGTDPESSYILIYRIMVYFWIIFGMAFMATVWTLITDFYKKTGERGRGRVRRRQTNISRHGEEVDGEVNEKEDPHSSDRTEENGDNSDTQDYIEMTSKPAIYTIGISAETEYENTKLPETANGGENLTGSD